MYIFAHTCIYLRVPAHTCVDTYSVYLDVPAYLPTYLPIYIPTHTRPPTCIITGSCVIPELSKPTNIC